MLLFYLQQRPNEDNQENGGIVSASKEVSVESMDNIETVFLNHPRHHRCCLTCSLTKLNITAQKVDAFSRIAFPILFAIFNLAYWSVYMHKRRMSHSTEQ